MEIKQAQKVVISLAKGIDPMTGEIFLDDSPYMHPTIVKSLFTVASNLRFAKKHDKKSIDEKQAQNLNDGKPKNAGMPWTKELKQEVSSLFGEGKEIDELADYFERTEGAISSELKHQGLIE